MPEPEAANFTGLFPSLPAWREQTAFEAYKAIFPRTPLSAWQKQGTLITRFVNGKKLNFAARRFHTTIGFQGHAAVEFYRFLGGDCPVGEVNIKPPYDREWDAGLIADTVDWYFNN